MGDLGSHLAATAQIRSVLLDLTAGRPQNCPGWWRMAATWVRSCFPNAILKILSYRDPGRKSENDAITS